MSISKMFFVGLGGAGQRHLRVFKELLPAGTEFSAFRAVGKTPLLNSDFSVNTDSTVESRYNLRLFDSIEEGLGDRPDVVVVSTPTSLHYDVALEAAKRGSNLIVEKPFSNTLEGFDRFRDTVLANELHFLLSLQRRFHPYLRRTREIIASGQLGKMVTAVFNVGTYVPAWHKYEDFRELYACRRELGGGVLLTECHELDLAYWYFGLPHSVYCSGGNYSDVRLDVEDTVHLTLRYPEHDVQLNLSFMQEYVRRDFYIAGTKGYVSWDAEGNRLTEYYYETQEEKGLADPEYQNDTMFIAQATHFIEGFSATDSMEYLNSAEATLTIIEAARQSMREGREMKTAS